VLLFVVGEEGSGSGVCCCRIERRGREGERSRAILMTRRMEEEEYGMVVLMLLIEIVERTH
jgi:hypothetical protein